jgi:2'-5' RNA ligase
MHMEKARLFLAVEIDRAVREALAEATTTLSRSLPGVRWVTPENMHITVKFFGSIPLERVRRIDLAMRHALKHQTAFSLEIARLGVFPSRRRPSVIWADVTDGSKRLIEVADLTLTALDREGFAPEERTFVPHLTLGRIKRGRRVPRSAVESALDDYALRMFGRSEVSRLTLFSSDLTPEGPIYTDIASWPLS